MNGKQLVDMALGALSESERQRDNFVSWSGTVKRSIERQARAIADKPDTPIVHLAGVPLKKVADWTDEHGTQHFIVYVRATKVVSVALKSTTTPSGRKKSAHELFRLPPGHLYEHFKPFMD
jgi:hypothetical protein